MELCSSQSQRLQSDQQQQSASDKVIKNLVSFVSADPTETPPLAAAENSIVTLRVREAKSEMARRGPTKDGDLSSGLLTGDRGKSSSASAAAAAAALSLSPAAPFLAASDEAYARTRVQTRGARLALETVARHFGADVFERLPKLGEVSLLAVATVGTPQENTPGELVFCLRALQVKAQSASVFFYL